MNERPHLTSNATILVTGAAGFVGAYVVRDLIRRGYRVKALRRRNLSPSFIELGILERAEWIQGDILNVAELEEHFENVDGVVHAAANVSFDPRDSGKLFRTNVEGTANVVNAAIQCGVKKFVHVSSVAAIGMAENNGVIHEKTPWQNNRQQSNYGVSKYEAEMEVWRAIAEGLDAVIVNPSTVLGFGDWNQSSCALFKNIYKGFPWYSEGVNGFVGVEDLSKAIVCLLESTITAERFIVSAEPHSYQEIFNAIADGFQKKRPARKATPFLAAIAWRAEKIRSLFNGEAPRVTRETARVALSNKRYEAKKLISMLPGFSYTPISEVISEACEKYSKNLPL